MRVGLTVLIALVLAPFVAVPQTLPAGGAARSSSCARWRSASRSRSRFACSSSRAEFAGHFTGYQIGLSLGSLIDPQTRRPQQRPRDPLRERRDRHLLRDQRAPRAARARWPIPTRRCRSASAASTPSLAGQRRAMLGLVFVLGVRHRGAGRRRAAARRAGAGSARARRAVAQRDDRRRAGAPASACWSSPRRSRRCRRSSIATSRRRCDLAATTARAFR